MNKLEQKMLKRNKKKGGEKKISKKKNTNKTHTIDRNKNTHAFNDKPTKQQNKIK